MSTSSSPTPRFSGSRLGPPTVILSRPEIRAAEVITVSHPLRTRDGRITARPGDIAITAYGGETYPIPSSIFFGTYEILGSTGDDLIAQRLIHVRTAWQVLEDSGVFDYGDDRGKVPVERGSWIYQSDDEDFGTLHAEVKPKGHLDAGPYFNAEKKEWHRPLEHCRKILSILPPLLALMSLGAFFASSHQHHAYAMALTALEVVFLVAGTALVLQIKRKRWQLKSCVATALELAREFQPAVQLLGRPASRHFPGMSLWRAAQAPTPSSPDEKAPPAEKEEALVAKLKKTISERISRLEKEIRHMRSYSTISAWLTISALALILLGNLYIILACLLFHQTASALEIFLIWLPSVVAAVHGIHLRERAAEKEGAMLKFNDQLRFAREKMLGFDKLQPQQREALLRMICKAAGEHSQQQLRIALSSSPPLPL